jgi:hypothetical protein
MTASESRSCPAKTLAPFLHSALKILFCRQPLQLTRLRRRRTKLYFISIPSKATRKLGKPIKTTHNRQNGTSIPSRTPSVFDLKSRLPDSITRPPVAASLHQHETDPHLYRFSQSIFSTQHLKLRPASTSSRYVDFTPRSYCHFKV